MKNVEKFIRPSSLQDLLKARKEEENNVLVAGGTSVVFTKDPNVKVLIDMADVPELKEIRWEGDTLQLGSMVTMTAIRRGNALPSILREAALAVASTPIRNVVTVGGEIMRGVYWTDFPVALVAMDGVAVFASLDGERRIPLAEVYESHPTQVIDANEVLVRVEIPDAKTWKGKFIKFSKTATDYALASVALAVRGSEVRVVVGAVTPLPRRLPDIEKLLAEKGAEGLDEVENLVASVTLRPDFRISADYQRNLMAVGIRRAYRDTVAGGEA